MTPDYTPILKNISRFVSLTAEEEAIVSSGLRVVKVRKKQCIVQPDFVCQYRSYVVQGALHAYLVDPDGQPHTIALAVNDWWIADISSYINQQPATLFVEAVEETTLIQLSYTHEQVLYEQVPKFERFSRMHIERAAAALQKRMLGNLSQTAEERYAELANRYPQFLSRFPQYILASYLGMTTQFLSKIRHQKAKS